MPRTSRYTTDEQGALRPLLYTYDQVERARAIYERREFHNTASYMDWVNGGFLLRPANDR